MGKTTTAGRRVGRYGLRAVMALAVVLVVLPACNPPAPPNEAPPPTGLPDGVPAAAVHPEPVLPTPAGWPFPDRFSRTAGTSRLAGGALEWTDFIYDDHGAVGANLDSPYTGLAPAEGTYTYPEGPARNNGADLFRVGIGLEGSSTYWRVDWNTLDDPQVPVVAFAIDADRSAATGGSAWGAGTGIQSAGIDTVLVISSQGAALVDPVTGVRTALAAGTVTVDHSPDRAMGSFVARVPTSALPSTAATWRVRVASGLATVDGTGFAPVPAANGALPGQPNVYNVGFRSVAQEQPGMNFWMEDAQAAALTSGNVSAFSTEVNWAALAADQDTPEPLVTGYSNRWYVSSLEPGKGAIDDTGDNPAGDLRPNLLGRVQPYAVYVPTTYDPAATTPTKLTWLLHSLGEQHNQYGAFNPKFLQQACEARQSICATTAGRGPDGWYFDEAEVDFWEVWHALAATYKLDPDQTVISGYSMGGWAAYKLGLAYPDLFANAVVLAGPQICGIRVSGDTATPVAPGRCTDDGKSAPLLGNARWLPYYIGQGALDQLVPVTGVEEQVNDLDALGYRYRYELFPTQDHLAWVAEDTFASAANNMGDLTRTRNPGRITYRWFPDLTRSDLGIGPTGVYWVRGIHARDKAPGVLASIDVTSAARPDPAVTPVRTTGPVVTSDTPPLVGTFRQLTWALGPAPAAQPTIAAQLTNVSVLSFVLGRAGLAPGQRATITVTSDGPVRLGLAGLAPGQGVQAGTTKIKATSAGTAAVSLPAGASTVILW